MWRRASGFLHIYVLNCFQLPGGWFELGDYQVAGSSLETFRQLARALIYRRLA